MSVGALAAHLARAAFVIVPYLDASVPDPGPEATELLSADQYFERLPFTADLHDPAHVGVRTRAAEGAEEGHAALLERLDATLAELDARFGSEPEDRAVAVTAGLVLPLDEYLVTRMVEVMVHSDDLAASAGLETPEFDPMTRACVVGCLLAIVRLRHGDTAVVRAFTRRERDSVDALRAI